MGVVFFTAALGGLAAWWAGRRRGNRSKDQAIPTPEPLVKAPPAPRALGLPAFRPREVSTEPADDASNRGPQYRLTYTNPYGDITDRVIKTPRRQVLNGVAYLDAWCSRRGERRTFRATRIIDLLHANGEEVRDPITLLALKAEGGGPKRLERLDGHDHAMSKLKPSLSALLWITRTDREIDVSEITILTRYAELHQTADGNRSELNAYKLGIWIDDAAPTIATALLGLMQMTPDEKNGPLFRECAEQLVRSDGLVDGRKARKLRQLLPA